MSIVPLPVFEADADPAHRDAMSDAEIYARLEPPKTIVVRFGLMKLIGEFPYDGDAKPGCGTKLVVRTHRGTELAEMLTTTCENAGCAKSVTRNEMLEYIENSGGRDYPFHTDGRVLRVATVEDLNARSALEEVRRNAVRSAKALINELRLPMKFVEAEPILGREQLTIYFMADERVDFREMVRRLAGEFKTRIEMRQVGARDEARLVADYERCGQHCCCKNFLKVLKPVSMKQAKNQQRPLEAMKISGRCGRLMCCLRYEDQTYRELRKNIPKKNTRVGTIEGPGRIVDSKILVQLVLVRLEHDGREIAVPVEELLSPDDCPQPGADAAERERWEAKVDPLRGMSADKVEQRTDDRQRRKRGRRKRKAEQQDAYREAAQQREAREAKPSPDESDDDQTKSGEDRNRDGRRRRRRRRRGSPDAKGSGPAPDSKSDGDGKGGRKRSRRRRRRRGGGSSGSNEN